MLTKTKCNEEKNENFETKNFMQFIPFEWVFPAYPGEFGSGTDS
jgi:hypothetical protein